MASNGVLAPIFLILAVTLQGCVFSNYRPAVKFAIGHQCHEKVSKMSDDAALKDVHLVKACNKLDAKKLEEFEVTNCNEVLHDVVHFAMGAGCEHFVGLHKSVVKSCRPFKGEPCKAAVDGALQQFPPEKDPDGEDNAPNAKEEAEKFGVETLVGLVKHCSAVVTKAVASDSIKEKNKEACEKGSEGNEAMEIMGVDASHCIEFVEMNMVELATMACVLSAPASKDAPDSADAVTGAFIKKHAKEFGEALTAANNPEDSIEEGLGGSETERLRLFQALQHMKWPGKLRRWSPASVMAAWVSSGLALVALLGLAWRRHSTRQPAPQDQPILDDELQLAE